MKKVGLLLLCVTILNVGIANSKEKIDSMQENICEERIEILPTWSFAQKDNLANSRYQDSKRTARDFFENSSRNTHNSNTSTNNINRSNVHKNSSNINTRNNNSYQTQRTNSTQNKYGK